MGRLYAPRTSPPVELKRMSTTDIRVNARNAFIDNQNFKTGKLDSSSTYKTFNVQEFNWGTLYGNVSSAILFPGGRYLLAKCLRSTSNYNNLEIWDLTPESSTRCSSKPTLVWSYHRDLKIGYIIEYSAYLDCDECISLAVSSQVIGST